MGNQGNLLHKISVPCIKSLPWLNVLKLIGGSDMVQNNLNKAECTKPINVEPKQKQFNNKNALVWSCHRHLMSMVMQS